MATVKGKTKKAPPAKKPPRAPKIETESRGMRLPKWLWGKIDTQAKNKRISTNQHAAELLAKAV